MPTKKVSKKTKTLRKARKAPKKASRRTGKVLTSTLYLYTEPGNFAHAKTKGRKAFGSASNYVNHLIARDRGVKAKFEKRATK